MVALLDLLQAVVLADQVIHLVLDNLNIHRGPAAVDFLARVGSPGDAVGVRAALLAFYFLVPTALAIGDMRLAGSRRTVRGGPRGPLKTDS